MTPDAKRLRKATRSSVARMAAGRGSIVNPDLQAACAEAIDRPRRADSSKELDRKVRRDRTQPVPRIGDVDPKVVERRLESIEKRLEIS